MGQPQRWHLSHPDHDDVVEVTQGSLVRRVAWTRDGVEMGSRRTSDETIVVTPAAAAGDAGAVRAKFSLAGSARRITLHGSEAEARTGLGGTDFEPETGSKAAVRAEWIGRHPHLHTARQTAVAAAGVAVPFLVVWLLTLIPWPDVDIPWPDLPSIPWPDIDLPAIPWPDLNLPALPDWMATARKFLVPILIAFFIARGEVKRRRRAQDDEVTPGPMR